MNSSEINPKPEGQASANSGLSLSDEDALKFMIERAHFESQLYWTRTSVFLLINAAASGLAVKMITGPGDWTLASLGVFLCVAVVGSLFGIVWWRMQRVSQYYNLVWMADARRVAINSQDAMLSDRYLYALGLRSRLFQRKAKENQLILSLGKEAIPVSHIVADSFEDFTRPRGKSATEYMESVVIGVIVIWLLMGAGAVIGIVLLSRHPNNSHQSNQSNRGMASAGLPHNTGGVPDADRALRGRRW